MRVLHLRSSGGFYGAEALIQTLARAQHAGGTEVDVAGLVDARESHTELLERLNGAGVRTHRVRSAGRVDVTLPARIAALARNLAADVLHTHDYKTAVLGLVAAKTAKVPVVSTFHGEVGAPLSVHAYELVARAALRLYDGVALVSRQQIPVLGDRWRRSRPVFIPNAVDVEALALRVDALRSGPGRTVWRAGLGLGPEEILVGTVGRIDPGKGQRAALPAVAEALRAFPQARWVLAGEGQDRAELEAEAERLGVGGQVRVLGFVRQMETFYGGVDALLHPSFREGLPMVVLEAMAAGLPVAASPVGEISELLVGGVGVLIENRNEALSTALRRILAEPDYRRELGQAARTRVREQYGMQRLARQYEELYAQALRGWRARAGVSG